MAFDHGAPTIVPINFAIIVALSVIWWPIAPWWVILPLAIILAYLTMDPYSGMFICLIILICALTISIPLTAQLGDISDLAPTDTYLKLLITGLFSFIVIVIAIFGFFGLIGWLLDRKITLRLGKKVKIIWGIKKGEIGRVEHLDPDGLIATIRLKDSGEIVRYPSNVFFEEPHWWNGREKELPQGTKMKVYYGIYENYLGTVLEYDTGTHAICVKLNDIDDRLWYASNLVEPEKS
jgi:hypothetical protein